jgi:Mn-dependent DtxR family transcriptional regulator
MLTESMEDYLEMIYRLLQKKGYVRAVDLAEALKVQPSSVTRMIQKLDECGFIYYEKYRNVGLTPLGEKYGKFLAWRDEMLKEFFRLLNAKTDVEEQVEGIEHYITPNTMSLIRNLVNYFNQNLDRLKEFKTIQSQGEYPDGEKLVALRAWDFKHNDLSTD